MEVSTKNLTTPGEMDLMLNDRIYKVKKDESFYFFSHTSHDWANRGKEDTVVAWVITPPTF